MKRYVVIATAVLMGMILAVTFVYSIGWAQTTDNPNDPACDSSAPLPDGVSCEGLSPSFAIQPAGADDVEAAPEAPMLVYNASLRVSGSALKPRESGGDWTGSGSGGGCIYVTSGASYAIFNTPVYLPQGSTVKYFRLYYNDTSATHNAYAWFTVYDLYGGIVDEWPVYSSGDGGNGYATTDEFTHTVDYNRYSYMINWRPNEIGSAMQVCGFRVYYHTPPGATYLPIIENSSE